LSIISPGFALVGIGALKRLKVTGLAKLPAMTAIHTSTRSPSSTVYPVRSNPTVWAGWTRRQRVIENIFHAEIDLELMPSAI